MKQWSFTKHQQWIFTSGSWLLIISCTLLSFANYHSTLGKDQNQIYSLIKSYTGCYFFFLNQKMTFVFRYELNLSQSFLSLPQFCLHLSGVCVVTTVQWSNISSELIDSGISPLNLFLILSSLGHFLSLTSGQYLGLMIQHENSLSLSQRCSIGY